MRRKTLVVTGITFSLLLMAAAALAMVPEKDLLLNAFFATHAEARTRFRFLRLMPDNGGERTMARRLLECRRLRAPADVARALDLKAGDAVVQLRRLLLAPPEGAPAGAPLRPVVLDDIWLPGSLFRGLTAERLATYKGPMYGMFESEFGVRMIRAEERIRAVAADEQTAALLKVAPGAPLLSVERLSYTYGDRPVELRRVFHVAVTRARDELYLVLPQ